MEDEKTVIENSKKGLKKVWPKLNDNELDIAIIFGEGIAATNTMKDRGEQSAEN